MPFSMGIALRRMAQEVGVLAEAELSKRTERTHLGVHAIHDLYGPLRSLQCRIEAMGELMPRVFRANSVEGKVTT